MHRLSGALGLSVFLFLLFLVAMPASAGITEGSQWLSQQTLPGGEVSNEAESLASVLQVRSESASALMALQALSNGIPSLTGTDADTESLARYSLWLRANGLSSAVPQQALMVRQVADGGFGHVAGWRSDPVDTALVLLALADMPYGQTQQAALDYLTQDGLVDVFYADLAQRRIADYYILSALTVYLPHRTDLSAVVAEKVSRLEQAQTSPGQWSTTGDDYFIDALLTELLHLYRLDATAAQSFKERVLALQRSNGSWEDDAYVTAVVLRALNSIKSEALNPLRSAFTLTILDTETGVPLSGISAISLTPESAEALMLTTDAYGGISKSNIAPGVYKIIVSGNSYLPLTLEANIKAGQRHNFGTIQLSKLEGSNAAVLSGQVLDEQSGIPIANALVTSTATGQSARTSADGMFQIVFTTAGNYALNISADSFQSMNREVSVVAGTTTTLSLGLVSGSIVSGSLFGRVVDASGQPLAGVVVSYGSHELNTYINFGTTDANGVFSKDSIALGDYKVDFTKSQYIAPTVSTSIVAGSMTDIGTVTMQSVSVGLSTGTIKASARNNSTGAFVRHINVLAEQLDASGNVVQRQTYRDISETDMTLQVGRWRVTVSHPAYTSASATYTLNKGQVINPGFYISLKNYGLDGSVVDSLANQPLSGISVSAVRISDGYKFATTTTSASGSFAFSGIPYAGIKVEINATRHLSTVRWFNRDVQGEDSPSLGEVRLRPLSATEMLPDLMVKNIGVSGMTTNIQSLVVSGSLDVTLRNRGIMALAAGSEIKVLAFIDENRNQVFDDQEPVLGQVVRSGTIGAGQELGIQIPLSSRTLFRDAPVGVWVDAEKAIAEAREDNNIRFTSDDVEIAPLGQELNGEVVWSNKDVLPGSHPVAAPLRDTNGDGKIGEGDVADIAVTRVWSDVAILNGETGALLWVSGECKRSWYSPSIADLDKDGIPEIVVACRYDSTNSLGLDVYSNDGRLLKRFTNYNQSYGFSYTDEAKFYDVDGDGVLEIVVGNHIFNYVTGNWLYSSNCSTKMLADISGDGVPEIISDTGVCDLQGTLKSSRPSVTPFNKQMALGDVFGLGAPQIIQSHYALTIDDNKGRRLARYVMSGDTGAPTVADYDGDGVADIGLTVGNGTAYSVFRADGSVIWSMPIDGYNNDDALMPAFDFDGDGSYDAIVQTLTKLYVFDGKTGAVRLSINNNHYYPQGAIIVDADADGHADIVLPSFDGQTGVRMISGQQKDWPATRNIWNQNQYRITNINDDLSVPSRDPSFWKTHNTFRANALLNRKSTAASDATASFIRVRDGGLLSPAQFTVRIGNGGGKDLPSAMPVSFWQGNPASGGSYLGTVNTSKALVSGDYEDVVYDYTGGLVSFGELYVVANEDAARVRQYPEVAKDNNVAHLAIADGFGGVTLSVSSDKANYAAQENAALTAALTNLGSFSATRDVQLTITDAAGNLVATLPLMAISADAGATAQSASTWNTGLLHAGVYGIRADVIHAGQVIASSSSAFMVGSQAGTQALTAIVTTNRASYSGLDQVQVAARVINPSANQVYEGLVLMTRVLNPAGQEIWMQSDSLAQMQPQDLRDRNYSFALQGAAPGNYQVIFEVRDAANALSASATAVFAVASSAATGQGVTGQLQLPASMVRGESVGVSWTLSNQGNAAVANLPVRIAIINPDTGSLETVIGQETLTVAQAGSQQRSLSWQVHLAQEGTHVAVLQFEFEGQWQTKAQRVFTLTKPAVSVSVSSAHTDYRLGDSLIFSAMATNQSPILLGGIQGVIRLYDPAGQLWYEYRANHQDWAAGASWQFDITRTLVMPAAAGAWRADVRVEDAGGSLLASNTTAFNVLSSLLDGTGLSGALTAQPNEVEVGQPVVVGWQIQNGGNADFTALPLRIALRKDGATTDERIESVVVGQLVQGGSDSGIRSLSVSGSAGSHYTASLSVEVGGYVRQLGTASFVMKAPAITQTVEVSPAVGSRSRLLVYYSCQPGWHTGLVGWILGLHNNACFSQREQTLRSYLDPLGTPYKLVKDEDDFVRDLRSGEYNNIWLLGAIEPISPWLMSELTEVVNRGDSLVIDAGVQSWLNYDLMKLSGVAYRGRLGFTDNQLHLDAPVFPESHRSLVLHNKPSPLFFKVLRGDVTAWWDAQHCNLVQKSWPSGESQDTSFYNQAHNRYPAMVTSTYGKGRTVALAFDLVGSLQNTVEAPQWLAMFSDSISHVVPAVQSRKRLPAEQMTLSFPVKNPGQAALTVEVEMTLPAGTNYLGGSAPGTVLANGHVRWSFVIPAAATQALSVDVRVPTARGTYNVEIAVRPQGSTTEPQRFVQSFEVEDPLETRITRIRQQIESLPLTSFAERSIRTQVLWKYQQAQLAFGFNFTNAAIGHWVGAASLLGNIGHGSAAPARLELDLLIKELEARWVANPR